MSEHTPGPWHERQDSDGQRSVWADGIEICSSWGEAASADMAANVRLIAAAPDMLEALEGMVRIVKAFGYTTQLGKSQKERLVAAEAAIKAAKGSGAEDEGRLLPHHGSGP